MSSDSYHLNLERRATIDEELRRVVLGLLDGKIGVIAASRILARLRIDVSTAWPEMGEALNLFAAVDSETDALPMGPAREMWTPSALEREDHKIAEAEARFRDPVRIACQHVLQLLGDDVMILWRPVGPRELELISASGMREFPPRLPEQPIFYPVTTEAYAIKIARDWNAPRGGGFVTRFQVRRSFISRYPIHIAGGRENMEYWIPAEDLVEFNGAIVGQIEIVAEFPNRE
ncbi:hypothetical protein Ms3S1_31610 [Methylosinus sp. 3S-1]